MAKLYSAPTTAVQVWRLEAADTSVLRLYMCVRVRVCVGQCALQCCSQWVLDRPRTCDSTATCGAAPPEATGLQPSASAPVSHGARPLWCHARV